MTKQKNRKSIPLEKLILLIIIAWLLSGVIIWYIFNDWTKSGPFGDTFGAINSLFSGLALAGIIYTIFLQKNELELQRKELKYTRKELKRTANAQEQSAKMMNEQIRLSNLPFLQYHSQVLKGKKCLMISNQSDNPTFDIDIWLFLTELDSSYPLSEFIDDWIKDDHEVKIKPKDLIDGDLYGICERAIYHSFPRNKKIIIPIDYPIGNGTFEIYVQYRDNLGHNYSQKIYFMGNKYDGNPFQDAISEPNFPTVTERVDFTHENLTEEDVPEIAQDLVNLKNVSIFCSYLKNRDKIGVENFWEMKDI